METCVLLLVAIFVGLPILLIKEWLDKRACERTASAIRALVGTEGDDEEQRVLTYTIQCKLRGFIPSFTPRHPFLGGRFLGDDTPHIQFWRELNSQTPQIDEALVARWRERWRELKEASRLTQQAVLAKMDRENERRDATWHAKQAEKQRRKAVKKAEEEIILHLAGEIKTGGRICR